MKCSFVAIFAVFSMFSELAHAGCLLKENTKTMEAVCNKAMESGLYSQVNVSPTCGMIGVKWIQIANQGMCGCCVLKKEAPAGASNNGGGIVGAVSGNGIKNIVDARSCVKKNKNYVIGMAEAHSGYDKFKHCSVSCILKKRCGNAASSTAGFLKEVADLFDNKVGNSFGSGDLVADNVGLDLSPMCGDERCCISKCNSEYPRK